MYRLLLSERRSLSSSSSAWGSCGHHRSQSCLLCLWSFDSTSSSCNTSLFFSLLLLCSGGPLGRAILAIPFALGCHSEASAFVMSDLGAAFAAHDITAILTHIAVFLPVDLLWVRFYFNLLSFALLSLSKEWCGLFFWVFRLRTLRFLIIIALFIFAFFLCHNFASTATSWLNALLFRRHNSSFQLRLNWLLLLKRHGGFSSGSANAFLNHGFSFLVRLRLIFFYITALLRTFLAFFLHVFILDTDIFLLLFFLILFFFFRFRTFKVLDSLAHGSSLLATTPIRSWFISWCFLVGLDNIRFECLGRLDSLHNGLLVLAFHLLCLSNWELFTGSLKDLKNDEQSIQVVVRERVLLLHEKFPRLLHVLRWPEFKQLKLESLKFPGLAVLTLSCAQRSWQGHTIVKLDNEWHQGTDRFSFSDALLPSLSNFLFLPLAVMLTASIHVRVLNLNQVFLATLECDNLLEELFHRVLLIDGLSADEPLFLRDLLTKPDWLSDAVLPVVGVEHDSADLILSLRWFILHNCLSVV